MSISEEPSVRQRHLRTLETIARYEAVTKIADLAGSIAQVGVGDGFGLVTLAELHDLVSPFKTSTLFFGFDTFIFYPHPEEDERHSVEQLAQSPNQRFAGDLLEAVLTRIREYSSVSPFPHRTQSRFQLIEGPVEETLDDFDPSVTRFKLVEIDVNLRKGTRKALEVFYPLLTPGGLLIFGGYSSNDWPGETDEVHQFLLRESLRPLSFTRSTYPSSYVVKPWIH